MGGGVLQYAKTVHISFYFLHDILNDDKREALQTSTLGLFLRFVTDIKVG